MPHAAVWLLGALATLAIAYRYYSAFLAARVLVLQAERRTPAHEFEDGHNFHPTHRIVLFGHHFAAITGAGPLIGPVLAAQFGFLPGYLWILVGVCLAGAVHDMVVMVASVRRGGRSLAEIAREELGPWLGLLTMVAVLAITIIALAGLGNVVVGALAESAWGVFTVGASIPIALLMGLFIHYVRKDSARGIREATVFGVIALLVALWLGKSVGDSSMAGALRLSKTTLTLAIAAYGFLASVLPVWMLLCPRDYLSSYLKLGTIAFLLIGVLWVNPPIEMPAVTEFVHGGGPIVKGPLFPFVFITIACGAISGFHSLVASGTTPKMIDKETDCRPIAYGAMLLEGLVGIAALVAACVMPPEDYLAINTDPEVQLIADATGTGVARSKEQLQEASLSFSEKDRALLGLPPVGSQAPWPERVRASRALALSNGALHALGYSVDPRGMRATELQDADFARLGITVRDLPALSRAADEVVAARTGGGVSLAIGMARVFSGFPGMSTLLAYWYHFAIMFEALFVLTTIDTGTRIGRFLMQEFLGRASARLGNTQSRLGAVVATSLVVFGWAFLILTGNIQTLWPLFGVANQLLACIALAVGTTLVLKTAEKKVYALCTFLPLVFVGGTTLTAAVQSIRMLYWPLVYAPATRFAGLLNAGLTSMLLVCASLVLIFSARAWLRVLRGRAA